jgi:hypothetical protein
MFSLACGRFPFLFFSSLQDHFPALCPQGRKEIFSRTFVLKDFVIVRSCALEPNFSCLCVPALISLSHLIFILLFFAVAQFFGAPGCSSGCDRVFNPLAFVIGSSVKILIAAGCGTVQ